jgi:hypothetical protein
MPVMTIRSWSLAVEIITVRQAFQPDLESQLRLESLIYVEPNGAIPS